MLSFFVFLISIVASSCYRLHKAPRFDSMKIPVVIASKSLVIASSLLILMPTISHAVGQEAKTEFFVPEDTKSIGPAIYNEGNKRDDLIKKIDTAWLKMLVNTEKSLDKGSKIGKADAKSAITLALNYKKYIFFCIIIMYIYYV